MNKLANFKKWIFLLNLFALGSTAPALSRQPTAENLLSVAPKFYHIDAKRHLIVINQPLGVPGQQPITGLLLDQPCPLAAAVPSLQQGVGYALTRDGQQYTAYFTQLPIVELCTRHAIVDTPNVYADFALTEASGQATTSAVGIEIRGGNSQSYDKKSYELSFWTDTLGTASRDVQLLSMRTDDGWNLLAMFNERTRANNMVSHDLWHDIHQPYYLAKEPDAKSGIRLAYVEVFLNGTYKGLYGLSEKVDRKQLKLKKYNNSIKGELYKGSSAAQGSLFASAPSFDNTSELWAGFEYKYPDEQIDWTSLHDFVDFVATSGEADFNQQIAKRFRMDNAVDYFLFLNLLHIGDNTGKNLYVAKYNTGEPYFYVPWDLDGVFGYNWQGLRDSTTTDLLTNGLYQRLNQDCSPTGFRAKLAQRWTALRTTVLTEAYIMGKYRLQTQYLLANGALEREQRTWGNVPASAGEQAYIARWLHARLAYLDKAFTQPCPSQALAVTPAALAGLACYPNPAHDHLTIEIPGSMGEASIRDLSGHVLLQAALGTRQTQLPLTGLAPGLYLVSIRTAAGVHTQKLAVE